MSKSQEKKYLTVTELVSLLDLTLQEYIGELVFTGEINQVAYAQSGHIYFSLKDEDGKVDAVMWQGMARGLKFKLETGLAVVCQARPNVYKRTGKLQMVVSRIEPFGAGLLQKKFEELKTKLEKEGLFAESRKRKLPYFPKSVGIVSSKDGAVIHDIMHRITARMPSLKTYLIDTRVQGPGAADDIAAAISQFNQLKCVDVIIVARGGGALEDLWSFNEEVVVRAIFASEVPVISAVGHETDFTLADFVADLRAPTPSAAAELVVPSAKDLLQRLSDLQKRLKNVDLWLQPAWQAVDELELRYHASRQQMKTNLLLKVDQAQSNLRRIEPSNILKVYSERLTNTMMRMQQGLATILRNKQQQVLNIGQRVVPDRYYTQLNYKSNLLLQSEIRLQNAITQKMRLTHTKLSAIADRLGSIDHKKLLARGYALVYLQDQLVSSVSKLKAADQISVTMSDGQIHAAIDKILKE